MDEPKVEAGLGTPNPPVPNADTGADGVEGLPKAGVDWGLPKTDLLESEAKAPNPPLPEENAPKPEAGLMALPNTEVGVVLGVPAGLEPNILLLLDSLLPKEVPPNIDCEETLEGGFSPRDKPPKAGVSTSLLSGRVPLCG